MVTEIKFTKEQKDYLLFNLRWLNNGRVDRWLNYLPELIQQDALSETEECDCNACTLCEYNANNQKKNSEVKG